MGFFQKVKKVMSITIIKACKTLAILHAFININSLTLAVEQGFVHLGQ